MWAFTLFYRGNVLIRSVFVFFQILLLDEATASIDPETGEAGEI